MSNWMLQGGLLNHDCREYLKHLPDNSIDAVITDPPYGIDYVSNRVPEERKKDAIEGDNPADTGALLRDVFHHAHRTLKPGGAALVFAGGGGPTFSMGLIHSLMLGAGFSLENIISWDKLVFGQGWRYRFQWEAAMIFYKGDKRLVWNGGEGIGNVFRYQIKGHLTSWQEIHPTPKPLELLLRLVADNTDPGGLVLDPFAGTGVVPVACQRLGRRCLAFEVVEKYHAAGSAWLEADKKYADRRTSLEALKQGGLFNEAL